jgi:CarD family transcriptional regulator
MAAKKTTKPVAKAKAKTAPAKAAAPPKKVVAKAKATVKAAAVKSKVVPKTETKAHALATAKTGKAASAAHPDRPSKATNGKKNIVSVAVKKVVNEPKVAVKAAAKVQKAPAKVEKVVAKPSLAVKPAPAVKPVAAAPKPAAKPAPAEKAGGAAIVVALSKLPIKGKPEATAVRPAAPVAKPVGEARPVATKAPAVAPKAPVAAPPKAAAPAVDPKKVAAKPANQRHGFKTNEYIVYPSHGVGKIVRIEEQVVAGYSLELFVIHFEQEKMTLRVPTSKLASVGMRKLSETGIVDRAMETLKGRARIKRTMWSRRAQEYEAKINSGDLVSIAEVVRDLYRAETQPEQSYSERQLFEAALDRMSREIAAIENLDDRGATQKVGRGARQERQGPQARRGSRTGSCRRGGRRRARRVSDRIDAKRRLEAPVTNRGLCYSCGVVERHTSTRGQSLRRPTAAARCARRFGLLVSDTARGRIGDRRSAATTLGRGHERPAADARLRQYQLDAGGGFSIAGNLGDDRADLLVAGNSQESRCAAVSLHAGDVEARLWMGELTGAMRADGTATMLVRVDQRGERRRTIERGIEAEAELGEHSEVGPETRRHDELVGDQVTRARGRAAGNSQSSVGLRYVRDTEAGLHAQLALGHEPGERRAELTSRRELVVGAAAERLVGTFSAQEPDHDGVGRLAGKLSKIDEGADRRMAGAEHR